MRYMQVILILLPIVLGDFINEIEIWNGPGSRKGKYVNIANYPYVVSIRYAKSRKVICTGIILTFSWVLSVPHCFMLTPNHYKGAWVSNTTIPPVIEILAKKRNATIVRELSLSKKNDVLKHQNYLKSHKFGPFKYNKTLFTSTTQSSLLEDQIAKSTIFLEPNILQVIAGTSKISDCDFEGQTRTGVRIIIHPKFKQTLRKQRNPRHELALLKTNLPFIEKTTVRNAPVLQNFMLEEHLHKACQLVGWGRGKTKRPLPHLKTTLSEINVKLYKSSTCRYIENSYLKAFWNDDSDPWFCSYDEENHAIPICQSDSGGPLVCKGKVVALLSWLRTPTCFYDMTEYFQYYPIYYSRVYLDIDWLCRAVNATVGQLNLQKDGGAVVTSCENRFRPQYVVLLMIRLASIYLLSK